MSAEIFYAPADESSLVKLSDAQASFVAAGLPCKIEAEAVDMHWFIFDDRETKICASTKDDILTFATVHAALEEDPEFIDKIDAVFVSFGFGGDDGGGY